MSKTAHVIYIAIMVAIILMVLAFLIYQGFDYYNTPLEERFYHSDYKILKPSGIMGHGLGIVGTLLIIAGVSLYMSRKRFRSWGRLGKLKYWLEFHIFLCTLGPIMVLFHTSFKFGGIVSVSFWSMVAVFLSGIIGRFIYIQIPRTIEGRELSLGEIQEMKSDIGKVMRNDYGLDEESVETIIASTKKTTGTKQSNAVTGLIKQYFQDRKSIYKIRSILKSNNLSRKQSKKVLRLAKNELSLNRKIGRLNTMVNLFKYWHVAHLPFALVMLIIMVIHVVVTIIFGYRWIF